MAGKEGKGGEGGNHGQSLGWGKRRGRKGGLVMGIRKVEYVYRVNTVWKTGYNEHFILHIDYVTLHNDCLILHIT